MQIHTLHILAYTGIYCIPLNTLASKLPTLSSWKASPLRRRNLLSVDTWKGECSRSNKQSIETYLSSRKIKARCFWGESKAMLSHAFSESAFDMHFQAFCMLRLFAPHPVLLGRGIRDEYIKELHQKLDQVNAQVLEDSKATLWMWEISGNYFHIFWHGRGIGSCTKNTVPWCTLEGLAATRDVLWMFCWRFLCFCSTKLYSFRKLSLAFCARHLWA